MSNLPDFVVIGAQKAGSTYLLECLRDHPQIFMPPQEISFCEYRAMTDDDLRTFCRHFSRAEQCQTIGVKRPNLLGNENSPKWLAEFLPDAKLIAILRNPIERAVSGYFHYMATGLLPIQPPEEGLLRILDHQMDVNAYPRAQEVLEFGLYARNLERFEFVYPSTQIHVLLMDHVREHAVIALSQLFDFIGVRSDYVSKAIDRRPMRTPYSLTRLRIRKWLYEPTRRRPQGAQYLQAKRGPLSSTQRAFARLVDRFLLEPLFPSGSPKLSTIVRQRLIDYYRGDICELSRKINKPLDHWLA